MGLPPRREGAASARAHHSPAAAVFLDKLNPFFAGSEVTGGPLLVATIIALLFTNLDFAAGYERFWDTDFTMAFGTRSVTHGLAEWIDHALLPLFFVIIGADVKREIVRGALSRRQTAIFPMVGAIGALAGIGFTISLFIAQLAFGDGQEREVASLAILIASVVSGGVGYAILRRITRGSRH